MATDLAAFWRFAGDGLGCILAGAVCSRKSLRILPAEPRYIVPWLVYEITIRTFQGRFLLCPSKRANELILGVVGRAHALYPEVQIHGLFVLSNHMTWLVSVPSAHVLSKFMAHVDRNISIEMGHLYDWPGSLWERAYTPIPVVDDNAQRDRMKYLLSQGCKAGLVPTVRGWPGVQCADALITGKPQKGIWVNRTRAYRRRRRGKGIPLREFEEPVTVRYSPLPVFAHLSPRQYKNVILGIIREIEREARATFRKFVGKRRLLQEDPHSRKGLDRTPRPLCHATQQVTWMAYRDQLRDFLKAYREVFAPGWIPRDMIRLPVPCFAPSTALAA